MNQSQTFQLCPLVLFLIPVMNKHLCEIGLIF